MKTYSNHCFEQNRTGTRKTISIYKKLSSGDTCDETSCIYIYKYFMRMLSRVVRVSKTTRMFQAFVHFSTAFCHVDLDSLNEEVHKSAFDAYNVMRLPAWLNETAIKMVTPQ